MVAPSCGLRTACSPQRLSLGTSVGNHGGDDKVCDAGRDFSCAEKENLLVGKLVAGHAECTQDASERYGCRALDIVTKNTNALAIFA